MALFTVDGGGGAIPYPVEPFTIEYVRQDNQEQRYSGAMSSVITSANGRIVVRRIPGLRHSELSQVEAEALVESLDAGEVDIAGDALGETITVMAENVTKAPYGAEQVFWLVTWDAVEV